MGWLILIGLSGLVLWALLRKRSPRAPIRTLPRSAEERALDEQKIVLEAQMRQSVQKNRAFEITEAIQLIKSNNEQEQQEALKDLDKILHRSPDWEQWNILNLLQSHLNTLYKDKELEAPLPPVLLRVLEIFSNRPRASWTRSTGSKEHLRLQDLSLSGLTLTRFNLRAAFLLRCNFIKSQLVHLDLYASHLEHCRFSFSQLKNANFTGATVKNSSFLESHLTDSEWVSATVEDCDFSQTFWGKANVRGVRFSECSFNGADLSAVKGLSFSQLQSCFFDVNSQLPKDIAHRLPELM